MTFTHITPSVLRREIIFNSGPSVSDPAFIIGAEEKVWVTVRDYLSIKHSNTWRIRLARWLINKLIPLKQRD